VLGDVENASDVRRWVRHLDTDTLPAGGADFFRAWLGARAPDGPPTRAPRLPKPALLLHGTTADAAGADAFFLRGLRAPAAATVADRLSSHAAAIVAAPARRLTGPDSPVALSAAFAQLTVALKQQNAFQHLLIAGGATAAAVLSALEWTSLEVVHVWAPGVVTLRPLAEPAFFLTLKPGSYSWPAGLRRVLPAALVS
jgi:hypothetical protein